MSTQIGSLRRIDCLIFAVALILLAVSVFSAYRVRAAEEAAQFEPAYTEPVLVPARTVIPAALKNRIPESAEAGDTVTAFVSAPILVDDRTVIPPGAELKGELEKVSISGTTAKSTVKFNRLLTGGQAFEIETRQIEVKIPVQSDTEIIGSALRTLMGATLGAALGAQARDPKVFYGGIYEAAAASVTLDVEVPITVTLLRELEI
jgi:hypothetical protein